MSVYTRWDEQGRIVEIRHSTSGRLVSGWRRYRHGFGAYIFGAIIGLILGVLLGAQL